MAEQGKPTPGPWEACERGAYTDFDGNSRVILGNDRRIAVVQHSGTAEDEANARLIAKAWAVPMLVEALQGLEFMFARPNENNMYRFERIAAQFHRETGLLAPGKDVPAASPDDMDPDEKRKVYEQWVTARIDRARAALAAVEQSEAPTDG